MSRTLSHSLQCVKAEGVLPGNAAVFIQLQLIGREVCLITKGKFEFVAVVCWYALEPRIGCIGGQVQLTDTLQGCWPPAVVCIPTAGRSALFATYSHHTVATNVHRKGQRGWKTAGYGNGRLVPSSLSLFVFLPRRTSTTTLRVRHHLQ